ncbi:unnamed protein product [Rotaria sp. Silwood2]|nr:unnamed protein product [Rotaria sp. Silwood2]
MPTSNNTTINNDKLQQQQLLKKYEKQIRWKKLALLAIHISQAEQTYYRFQNLFDCELSKMWQNHRNIVKNQGMTATLINILEQRLNNITNCSRDVYNYRIDYFLQNSYDELDHMNINEIEQMMKIVSVSSSIIIDTIYRFNDTQLQLLSPGPSYVSLCLITADNMNTFYVGNIQDFETKADKYLTRSDDYKVLININDENNEKSFNGALKEMIESMNSLFEKLKTHKAVSDDLYKRLVADLSKIKLPYLYFLPNISKENGISLVSIITSRSRATWKIGKYLNQLLRPFADKIVQSTKFTDDTGFIQRFNHYANTERRLRPTTLFCAIKITNFYTLDEHQNMIDVIGYFLQDNLASNKLESLTIQTIRNLLYLFLYNNIFCYTDNIYTFTKGTPNPMELTETLSNIYLFVWQKKILKVMDTNIEFFGR